MAETFLLKVELVGQAGNDLPVAPSLSADTYYLGYIEKIKIVTPDNQVFEKDAEFSIPFDAGYVYILLIPNTQKDEIPVGSEIWVYKSLEEITRVR